MSSQPVTHIAAGETVAVLECCLLPDGKIRLRCGAGWVSMFSTEGIQLMSQVDAAEASAVAVDGMSGIAELNSQLAKEIGGDAVEERVYTVTMNKATCELRVGGMNLTVMKGPDFVASYQYTELANWEYQTKDGADRSLTLVKEDKSKVVLKTAEAREIADLMTAHATVVAEKKQAQHMEEHKRMAADGQLTGLFKTSQKVQAREGKDMSSDETSHVDAGKSVVVLESCLLEDGKIRLRCAAGWVSMFSNDTSQLLTKVEESPPKGRKRAQTGRRASIAAGMSGSSVAMAAFQRELESAGIDARAQKMFSCKQKAVKKWPKHVKVRGRSSSSLAWSATDKGAIAAAECWKRRNHAV